MLKRNVLKAVIAGVLLGAGAVNAADVAFPLSAEIGPFEQHARHLASVPATAKSGAVQAVFPRAELETYVATRPGSSPTIAGGLALPEMAETGPRI